MKNFQCLAYNTGLEMTTTCPNECICLSQTQVMCNTGGLTEMPLKMIPSTVEYLSLAKNAFAVIKSDAFKGLRNIRKLTLDGNNITTIKPFAFRGLPKLRELSIQHTPLTTISQFSFAGLQNITSILLGHNKIEIIEGYSFAGTSNVRLILLNNNPVHKVESRAFSGLRNVDHLIFPNGVKNLESDAFSELDYVGILKLAFMDLQGLKPYTFRGLSHVQLLAITDSDLGIIESKAFEGMTHIGSKSNNVRVIRFHGNHLLETPRKDAILIQNVETLSINKNHFPCDCHLEILLSSSFINSTVDFRQNNYCISPLDLNGKPISYIQLDNIGKCTSEILNSKETIHAFQNNFSFKKSNEKIFLIYLVFLLCIR
ncbi:Netrin-G1 ligand precursor, putative [Pediculus humanus corporis]|uniref:Netrin-G1 ligand, putative n=1 Tax=Pediculus humanus subsp. corporis TaxID=121224 RepID=E0VBF8_PEDHC|nr:Netrin-G1 ligand precursor, putative [Pediculus humanus corporis]EEB10714.1 Netrin-G1 ligand precursor, putative [Pediculus humanus corporis]